MNGAEQRARHTAVRTAERRLDDLETILLEMGAANVIAAERHRADVVQLQEQITTERAIRKSEIDALETAHANEERLRNQYRAIWPRLRWLMVGY